MDSGVDGRIRERHWPCEGIVNFGLGFSGPGLALFYGGLVHKRHVLSVLMQCFSITCLVSVLWLVAGYSLAFTDGGSLNGFIGGLSNALFANVSEYVINGEWTTPKVDNKKMCT